MKNPSERYKARGQAPTLWALPRAGMLACCWMLSGCGGEEEGTSLDTQMAKSEVSMSAPGTSLNPNAASPGPSPAATNAAVREAMTLFAAGTPSPTERDRLRGLLAQVIQRDDNPLAHFYYAECLRPEAASDANLAVEMYERYHKAAVGKVPEAAFRVGVCLETGMGPPVDLVQAMNWYRFAAEEGVRPAQMALAHAYHTGSGVPKSDLAAFTWLLLAGGPQDALLRDSILRKLDAAQIRAVINTAPTFVNYQVSLEFP